MLVYQIISALTTVFVVKGLEQIIHKLSTCKLRRPDDKLDDTQDVHDTEDMQSGIRRRWHYNSIAAVDTHRWELSWRKSWIANFVAILLASVMLASEGLFIFLEIYRYNEIGYRTEFPVLMTDFEKVSQDPEIWMEQTRATCIFSRQRVDGSDDFIATHLCVEPMTISLKRAVGREFLAYIGVAKQDGGPMETAVNVRLFEGEEMDNSTTYDLMLRGEIVDVELTRRYYSSADKASLARNYKTFAGIINNTSKNFSEPSARGCSVRRSYSLGRMVSYVISCPETTTDSNVIALVMSAIIKTAVVRKSVVYTKQRDTTWALVDLPVIKKSKSFVPWWANLMLLVAAISVLAWVHWPIQMLTTSEFAIVAASEVAEHADCTQPPSKRRAAHVVETETSNGETNHIGFFGIGHKSCIPGAPYRGQEE